MKYFDAIETIQELKKAYKSWAMKLHPDLGGSEEAFKAMSAEYESVFKMIKAGIKERTHSTAINLNDVDDGYRDVINALLSLDGVEVELCGEWLWITTPNREYNDTFKNVGCHWARNKKKWYWKPAWMRSRSRREHSMEEIRDKYGSKKFTGPNNDPDRLN